MTKCDTPDAALAFVQEHGVVLVSAKGPVPRLTEAIAGEPVKGSWWSHSQGRLIFAILEVVTASEQVLVCRLVEGKVTLVHRRLWPALVRLADRFPPAQLARVRQEHTVSGKHVNHEEAFPQWVPADVAAQAKTMDEKHALAALAAAIPEAR
jgi:hypothetical protein